MDALEKIGITKDVLNEMLTNPENATDDIDAIEHVLEMMEV